MKIENASAFFWWGVLFQKYPRAISKVSAVASLSSSGYARSHLARYKAYGIGLCSVEELGWATVLRNPSCASDTFGSVLTADQKMILLYIEPTFRVALSFFSEQPYVHPETLI